MNPEPLVSIIIPTFNRADLLREAVDSALAQTYPNLEIILADNASTDGTPALAAGYAKDARFRYVRNAGNIGMVRNWRKSLYEHAAGEWFLILSDDDLLVDPGYIKDAVALIGEFPKTALVYANGYLRAGGRDTPTALPFARNQDGKKIFLTRNAVEPQDFMLCNVLFNRPLALKLGAFSNEHDIACDSELFLKSCLSGDVGFIRKPVSVYRLHDNNLLRHYSRDAALLVNHVEAFVSPYEMAVESGRFTGPELALWRRRVILGLFVSIYKRIIMFHKGNLVSLTRELCARSRVPAAEFLRLNLEMAAALFRKILSGGGRGTVPL